MSGKTDARQQARTVNILWVSPENFAATERPIMRASPTSAKATIVLFLAGCPNFWVSVNKWGFQWGILSKTKWLAKARGIAKAGLPTFTAIAAPTTTCGVSNTVRLILTFRTNYVK